MDNHVDLLMCVGAESLFDLEQRLYEPRFMGVPIGATLTDFLVSRHAVGSLSSLWSVLAWQRFACFGPRHHDPLPSLASGRALVTWLADTSRCNAMVLPVLAELDPSSCNVIGGAATLQTKVPLGMGFCTTTQILKGERNLWRREYVRCRRTWHRQVWSWLKEHRLSKRLFPQFAYALEVRALYVAGFICFLDQVQPSAILTDSEHSTPWSCLILAAWQRSIPTLQMMHGVIYPPYGYTPLLSDVALCWGEQQREQMIALGTEPKRLLVTGCQRLTRTNRADRQTVRTRLGLPPDVPVIMLGTNPMLRSEWCKLVFTFCNAIQGQSNLVGVVRLHPSEKCGNYKAEIARCPGIRFFENQAWTMDEAMAACDVVVSHNSGLGNDALVMGRPVVLLDVLASPLSNGKALADKAGCPVVRTAAELQQTVPRIISDPVYRQALHAQAEKYVQWFCSAYGQDAARNVANEVRKRIPATVGDS